MGLIMGPVLLLRGLDTDRLRLCALTATTDPQGPGDLTTANGGPFKPEALLQHDNIILWRTEFHLPLSGPVAYRIAGDEFTVCPPDGDAPRVVFTACNGSEDPADLPPDSAQRLRLWRQIAEAHEENPFQLLIQGGDQIYADQVWRAHPALSPYKDNREDLVDQPFTDDMAEAVFAHYFYRYIGTWRQAELVTMTATVPSVMMWDDHDIIDGWGSWRPELQHSPVYQGLYRAARQTFAAFQLGVRLDEPLPDAFLEPQGHHFGWLYRLGDTAIFAPDLRSERTHFDVMGEQGWRDLETALEKTKDCQRLFIVSTVPVLNTTLRILEHLHFAVPGHQFFQDDLRDQWQSYKHADEWQRLTKRLIDFNAQTDCRVTVLSGEIHLGAWAVLETPEGPIHQLISSGVVHPPLPRVVGMIAGLIGAFPRRIGNIARFRMRPVPGFHRRYLTERNWLILDPTDEGYQATWYCEEQGAGSALELE